MPYKISEVSKMTDIPIDTIRYYEKAGIISPARVRKYRSYSEEDIYLLCEYKKMRSCGMKMDEVKEFFHIANMTDYAGKFRELQLKYQKMVQYYTSMEKSMAQSVSMIHESESCIGNFHMTELPAKYYIDFYLSQTEDDSLLQIWKNWIYHFYPLVEYIAIFNNEGSEISSSFSETATWVNAISQQFVEELHISINDSVLHIPAQNAVYTVVKRSDELLFQPEFIRELHAYLSSHHFEISGRIIGKLISRVREDSETIRYIGLWIPVRTLI